MTQIKTNKTNMPSEKQVVGEIADGTIQARGTAQKIKNAQRSTKLNNNTTKIYQHKPYNGKNK